MAPKEAKEADLEQLSTRKPWKKRLIKEASIFFAEICAINLALKLVSTSNKEKLYFLSGSISVQQ